MVTRDNPNGILGTGMLGMESMLKQLSDNRWLLLLQGVASIIFGILAIVWPGRALAVLIILFGWFVLVNGIVTIASAFGAAAGRRSWGWRLAAGILGVLAGLIILRWPGETAVTLLLFVGYWAIVVGIMELVGAIVERAEIPHAGLLAIEGIIAILWGIAMVVWPGVGLLTLALVVGIYAIVHGIFYCAMAFRVRAPGQWRLGRTPPSVSSGTAAD
jgi:uncharacterized membrane protein HdeD (DUF308 family)